MVCTLRALVGGSAVHAELLKPSPARYPAPQLSHQPQTSQSRTLDVSGCAGRHFRCCHAQAPTKRPALHQLCCAACQVMSSRCHWRKRTSLMFINTFSTQQGCLSGHHAVAVPAASSQPTHSSSFELPKPADTAGRMQHQQCQQLQAVAAAASSAASAGVWGSRSAAT